MATVSTVAVAPDPADEGTVMVVTDPLLFPDAVIDGPFDVTVYATGDVPSLTNFEIVRVVSQNVGGWVLERAQDDTGPYSILVGDNVRLTSDIVASYAVDVPKARATPTVDLGADAVGRMIGVRITPIAFTPDGETFGPEPTALQLRVRTVQTSADNTAWFDVTPTSIGLGGQLVLKYLDSSFLWLVPTARYMRFTMELLTGA